MQVIYCTINLHATNSLILPVHYLCLFVSRQINLWIRTNHRLLQAGLLHQNSLSISELQGLVLTGQSLIFGCYKMVVSTLFQVCFKLEKLVPHTHTDIGVAGSEAA